MRNRTTAAILFAALVACESSATDRSALGGATAGNSSALGEASAANPPAPGASHAANSSAPDQPTTTSLRDGDIVFQQSTSEQSRAISLATKSRYTHMGIVYIRDGRAMVFEAVQPVKSTPYARWAARGADGHVVIKRLKDAEDVLTPEVLAKMKNIGESFRGRPYDLAFAWDDERLYCSELVYKIYERAAGIKIGKLQKLGDFDLSHPLVKKKIRERYGNEPPLDEVVISPQAMFEDPRLERVQMK